MKTIIFKRYTISVSLIIGTLLLAIFSINATVDPLWYFKGNVITNQNFAFNERISKVNRFLAHQENIDCLIFGSSRTTLLNETQVEGYNCFNFSFSAGKVGEFISYGAYLKKRGFKPKLLIIGVDGFNFFSENLDENVPDFINKHYNPPSVLKNYLTKDALEFTAKTLLGKSPFPRYYKPDFTCDILDGTKPYNINIEQANSNNDKNKKYNKNAIDYYRKLFALFPEAKVITYVPPISIWRLLRYKNSDLLKDYLHGVFSVARLGVPLYDFSIPSYVTIDKSRTYDGSHYNVATNTMITRTINDGNVRFGVHVNRHTFQHYENIFIQALQKHQNMLQLNTSSPQFSHPTLVGH
jgi:hypothetical protein